MKLPISAACVLLLLVNISRAQTAPPPADENGSLVRDWRYLLTIHEIAKADDDVRLGKLLSDNPDRARTRTADGKTPVHVAAEFGALKSLRLLAKAGADFSVFDNQKRTPLTIAVALNYAQTVKTLLDLGADVNQLGSVAGQPLRTPVSIAARQGASDIMKILLDAKADVSKADEDGDSPLTSAAAARQWETMSMLLDHAANPDAKDRGGNASLIYAAGGASQGNSTERQAALAAVGALLQHKADPNIRDQRGGTPLLIATAANNEGLVGLLLDHGADPNLADDQGRTPMAATESPALWRLLAGKGAKVDVMVGEATRLQHYISLGNVSQVEGWLAFRPDPLVPDRHGRTAKELARALADKPSGSYEGDAARKQIAALIDEYQTKAWNEREAARRHP